MNYKTDGELYDDCLTAHSKESALNMYQAIIYMIDMFGFVTISDIVCQAKKGSPENWAYASTHGWNRSDVGHFTIKHDENKGWQIFLGNPRLLTTPEKNSCGLKKYLAVLSPRTKVPEDGWDVALVRIRLHVRALNAKEARKLAVETMERRHLYCKVTYIREMKGATE